MPDLFSIVIENYIRVQAWITERPFLNTVLDVNVPRPLAGQPILFEDLNCLKQPGARRPWRGPFFKYLAFLLAKVVLDHSLTVRDHYIAKPDMLLRIARVRNATCNATH